MVTATVRVSQEDGVVTVGCQRLEGWIQENSGCPACATPTVYYERYDAVFCPQCNRWLESQCGDASCGYCRQRPGRPLAGAER